MYRKDIFEAMRYIMGTNDSIKPNFAAVARKMGCDYRTARVEPDSVVVHDSLHGYRGIFANEVWVKSKVPEEEKKLDRLNHICSGIQWFLRKHRGITRLHLQSYLEWYVMIFGEEHGNRWMEDSLMPGLLQRKPILASMYT